MVALKVPENAQNHSKIVKNLQKFTKIAVLCVYRRFHLKKQTQFVGAIPRGRPGQAHGPAPTGILMTRQPNTFGLIEKTKPILERPIECKQFYRKDL